MCVCARTARKCVFHVIRSVFIFNPRANTHTHKKEKPQPRRSSWAAYYSTVYYIVSVCVCVCLSFLFFFSFWEWGGVHKNPAADVLRTPSFFKFLLSSFLSKKKLLWLAAKMGICVGEYTFGCPPCYMSTSFWKCERALSDFTRRNCLSTDLHSERSIYFPRLPPETKKSRLVTIFFRAIHRTTYERFCSVVRFLV